MKKITALDWISNSIKSEDLFENRSDIGLNKHVQKKFNNIDAVDNVSEYVDLGLPSRTLWCKHNYGTEKEYEYGELYTFDDAQELGIKLPTVDDFAELDEHCDHEWTEVNGVHGMMFTSKSNGESVFFPAAGYSRESYSYYRGIYGNYWSSSLYSATNVYNMWFYKTINLSVVHPKSCDYRNYSFSVREVQ